MQLSLSIVFQLFEMLIILEEDIEFSRKWIRIDLSFIYSNFNKIR